VVYARGVQRRGFLIGGLGAGALAGCRPWTRPTNAEETPDEHELATLAAIADTFLPGDDGTPGGHEVNAVATIVDPAYGVNPFISEVVSDLDQWCVATKGKGFLGLSRKDREHALEQRMGMHGKLIKSLYAPAYEGMLALTKLAFFGGLSNTLGTNFLAFPPTSQGYAPGSAAGVWSSREAPWPIAKGRASTIRIAGDGAITSAHVSVYATGDALAAMLRIHAPNGTSHDLPLVTEEGEGIVDRSRLRVAGPAAGAWRLEIASHRGIGRLEYWSVLVRTDLDDRAGTV
jgi:hypothetical protein